MPDAPDVIPQEALGGGLPSEVPPEMSPEQMVGMDIQQMANPQVDLNH